MKVLKVKIIFAVFATFAAFALITLSSAISMAQQPSSMPSLAGIYTGTLTEANGKVDVAQLILILNDKAFPKTPALSGTLSVCLLTKTCFNPGKTKEEQQAADEDTFTVGLLNDFKFDTTKSLLNLSFGIPGSTEVVGTVVGNTLLQLNVTGPRLRGKVSTTISNKVGFVDLTKIK